MVVCPLCEHAQERGTECEVCGRPFIAAPAIGGAVPVLAELEPTRSGPTEDPGGAPMPDLEGTSHAPVGAPPAGMIPDLEASAAAPVDVASEALPDIDRGLEGLPADAPTPYPAVVVCRYCRTEAQQGEKLCARCGMRLATPAVVPQPSATEDEPRLCSCGAPVRAARCPACGARNG